MTRREEILDVYRHKNMGFVPNFFTDFDYSQPEEILERPRGSGKDWFGVDWTFVPEVSAPMVTPGTKRLTDISRWRQFLKFPDLNSIDWASKAAIETSKWDRENKISFMMIINGPFERLHALMGFEDAFVAMYEEPEIVHELLDAIVDYKIELVNIVAEYYKPDVLCMHDDYGTNDRLFMSLDLWREFFKPATKKVVDAVHAKNMFYEHHSCGFIEPLIPELVELGIDAIDPLQVTNDIAGLKKAYQDCLTFVGGFDTQGVFDRIGVTEEEIRAEVRRTLDLLAPGGSYIAFPLTITFDFVPVFLDEFYKHAHNYGEWNANE